MLQQYWLRVDCEDDPAGTILDPSIVKSYKVTVNRDNTDLYLGTISSRVSTSLKKECATGEVAGLSGCSPSHPLMKGN